jgi:hypothetical protein
MEKVVIVKLVLVFFVGCLSSRPSLLLVQCLVSIALTLVRRHQFTEECVERTDRSNEQGIACAMMNTQRQCCENRDRCLVMRVGTFFKGAFYW